MQVNKTQNSSLNFKALKVEGRCSSYNNDGHNEVEASMKRLEELGLSDEFIKRSNELHKSGREVKLILGCSDNGDVSFRTKVQGNKPHDVRIEEGVVDEDLNSSRGFVERTFDKTLRNIEAFDKEVRPYTDMRTKAQAIAKKQGPIERFIAKYASIQDLREIFKV